MRTCSFFSVIVIAPIGAAAFVLPVVTHRLLPSLKTSTRRHMAIDSAETIEQLQQEIEAALEEREKLRQELQEEVREFQRAFDDVKTDLQNVDSRLDEQIKTFKQTFDTEKKSLEAKDANIVKQMQRLQTVKGGGVGGGGLLEGIPVAPVAALSVAATGFVARRESILREKREKARQEAAAKAKRAQQPTSAIVTSLVTGIIGMGLIAVSITGTIDKVNGPLGIAPRKEIFTIRKSETEKLEDLLAKLQVEPPEELNVNVGNEASSDMPSSKQVPVSVEKETETVAVGTTNKEEIANSETVETASKKPDTSPPKKVEVPNAFTKKANEGKDIPVLPKVEAKAEVDTNKAELLPKRDDTPTLKTVEEPIATKQDKIDDSNKVSDVPKQQIVPPVIENEPPVQEKAKVVAPTGDTENTKPDPIQTQGSNEAKAPVEVPTVTKVEKDDKVTSVEEEPTISKFQEDKPPKETVDDSSSSTTRKEQKESAEKSAVQPSENKLSSGTEKPTIAAEISELSVSKLNSDALDAVAQKNDEAPSDKAKTDTGVVAQIEPSAPMVGSVSKASSDVKGSASKATENVKLPESSSSGADSASKAIESLNVPDLSSLKDSVSKVFENQKFPGASDLTDAVAKSFANFKLPDASGLLDSVSKVVEELPRNPAALASIGAVLSATIVSTVLGMMKSSSKPDTKSEKSSAAPPNGARPSNDKDVAIPESQVSQSKHAPKKSLTPLEKRFDSEQKNGRKSPTWKDDRSHAKATRHSPQRHSHRPPSTKSSTPPISKTPNRLGGPTTGTSTTTKSMTPLEKKFGSAATSKNNGSEMSNRATGRQRHEQTKAKSSPSPDSVIPSGPTNSKTPLETKFAAKDVAKKNGTRNGSTRPTSLNGKAATSTPSQSKGVKSKTPLERRFERDEAKTSNGATKGEPQAAKTKVNPQKDRDIKAKPISEGPGKPPLKGKATITQSKRKYIMDAEFEPVTSNGSKKSDTTSDKASPALTNTPIVLDAVMDDVKGYATKVSGKQKDSTSSSGSAVVLDDSLMNSIKEYVKQQAGSSTSPVAVDALMESVKQYVQKQAGSKAPLVLDDALMESIKEYVNKQAGSISDS